MTTDDRKLVLVVDADPGFVDGARMLVQAHRSLTARDLSEAHEIVLGGRVDVVILGPGFASEHSISEAVVLRDADPTARIVLVADIVTNRLLKAALRSGFADVVDAPLTPAALSGLLPETAPIAPTPQTEVDLVLESPEGEELPVEATIPPPHHPSRYEPEPAETIGSGNGWSVEDNVLAPPVETPDPVQESVLDTPDTPPAIGTDPEPLISPAPTPAPSPQSSAAEPVPPTSVPATDGPVWPDEPLTVAEPPAVERTPSQMSASEIPPVEPPPTPAGRVSPPPMPPPEMSPPQTGDAVPAVMPFDDTRPPRPERSGPGRVIAVMAGKGGSGKSVVATNLAVAMGMRHDPERVAIVDADLQFGDVALMLQVEPSRTIDDVVGHLDSLTDARLDAALLRHESGLRVLPAPLTPVRHDEIPAKAVVEIVDRLRRLYDTIIVDTGPVFGDGLVTILEHADAVVAVVDMDLPSVKNGKVALDTLRGAGFPMERITLVVNRVNSKARLDLVELERSLGLRVGGSVPSDRLVPQSVNEGIPLLALSPRSKVARSFMALAERLDPAADRARLGGGGR